MNIHEGMQNNPYGWGGSTLFAYGNIIYLIIH